jgi:hypothetical protein
MNEEYRSIIGKILYFVKKVEPTCATAVRELSSFLDNPGMLHWKSVQRLAGYLAKCSRPLKMRAPNNLRVIGCVDSDWANDRNDRKSIGGYLITIGNCLVDWSSKKQASVALSSTEAEYMAYSDAAGTIKYLQMLTEEITGIQVLPSVLFEDNTGAIHLLNNDHIGKRTKHIDIRYRFVNDMIKEGKLIAKFRRTENNTADIMTKHVAEKLFKKHAMNIYEGLIFSRDELAEAERKEEVHSVIPGGGCLTNKEDVGTDGKTQATEPSRRQNNFVRKTGSGILKPSKYQLTQHDIRSRPPGEQAQSRPKAELRSDSVPGSGDLGEISENRIGTRHVPNVPRQESQSDPGQDQTVPEYLSNQPLDNVEGWSLVQKRSRRRKV